MALAQQALLSVLHERNFSTELMEQLEFGPEREGEIMRDLHFCIVLR